MKRLYQAAKELHGIEGQSRLAYELGESPQTLNNWEKRGVSKEGMLKAQKKFGISATWVETGAGPMTMLDKNVKLIPLGVREIPVISAIQAGRLKEISDPYSPGAGFARVFTDDMNLSRWTFALEIEGDSMLPEFVEGDRVIIDPEILPSPGDYVAAKNSHEEATFKRYRPRGMDKNGNMVFELVPLNEDYPTMRSDIEPLELIGTMAYHIRGRRKR